MFSATAGDILSEGMLADTMSNDDGIRNHEGSLEGFDTSSIEQSKTRNYTKNLDTQEAEESKTTDDTATTTYEDYLRQKIEGKKSCRDTLNKLVSQHPSQQRARML